MAGTANNVAKIAIVEGYGGGRGIVTISPPVVVATLIEGFLSGAYLWVPNAVVLGSGSSPWSGEMVQDPPIVTSFGGGKATLEAGLPEVDIEVTQGFIGETDFEVGLPVVIAYGGSSCVAIAPMAIITGDMETGGVANGLLVAPRPVVISALIGDITGSGALVPRPPVVVATGSIGGFSVGNCVVSAPMVFSSGLVGSVGQILAVSQSTYVEITLVDYVSGDGVCIVSLPIIISSMFNANRWDSFVLRHVR